VDPVMPVAKMDEYDFIISYLIDMEARSRRYKKRYPAVPVHTVRLEELSSIEKVNAVVAFAGGKPLSGNEPVFRRVNRRTWKKDKTVSLQYCRERLDVYIKKAADKGIILPATVTGGLSV
jgi:hypothetical protein